MRFGNSSLHKQIDRQCIGGHFKKMHSIPMSFVDPVFGQGLTPHGNGLRPHGNGLTPHGNGLRPHGNGFFDDVGDFFTKSVPKALTSKPFKTVVRAVRKPTTKILNDLIPVASKTLSTAALQSGDPFLATLATVAAPTLEKSAKELLNFTNEQAEKHGYGTAYTNQYYGDGFFDDVGDFFTKDIPKAVTSKPFKQTVRAIRKPTTKIISDLIPAASKTLNAAALQSGDPFLATLATAAAPTLEKSAQNLLQFTNEQAEKHGYGPTFEVRESRNPRRLQGLPINVKVRKSRAMEPLQYVDIEDSRNLRGGNILLNEHSVDLLRAILGGKTGSGMRLV